MDLKIKKLHKDVDALILYVLVAVYVFLPESLRVQAVDRLDDPLAIALLAGAGAGRFAVRIAATRATGKVRVERLAAIGHQSWLDEFNTEKVGGPAGNLPAGVTHIDAKRMIEEEGDKNA